jgi:hypothetical protein
MRYLITPNSLWLSSRINTSTSTARERKGAGGVAENEEFENYIGISGAFDVTVSTLERDFGFRNGELQL